MFFGRSQRRLLVCIDQQKFPTISRIYVQGTGILFCSTAIQAKYSNTNFHIDNEGFFGVGFQTRDGLFHLFRRSVSDGAHPGYLPIMESNHSGRTATERSFYQLGEVDAHTFAKVCISREAVNNGSPTSMPNSGQCHRYNSRNSQNS